VKPVGEKDDLWAGSGRPLIAEFLGTALLLAGVVGSGIMADRLSPTNTGITLLANAFTTAAILYVLITLFGPRSGAHFNPVVTGVFLLKREITASLAISYVLAQLLGAVSGVLLANAMFDLPVIQVSTHIRTGMGQWIGEVVATFGLIMTILGGKRQLPGQVPVLVAAWIGAACWFTSSTSFANPAVTLARAFTNTFTGIAPQSITGFVLAQLIGAFLAAAILPRLFFGTWFGVNKPKRNQNLKE
jgi:glycerol uptake facilitator-like aquaporin